MVNEYKDYKEYPNYVDTPKEKPVQVPRSFKDIGWFTADELMEKELEEFKEFTKLRNLSEPFPDFNPGAQPPSGSIRVSTSNGNTMGVYAGMATDLETYKEEIISLEKTIEGLNDAIRMIGEQVERKNVFIEEQNAAIENLSWELEKARKYISKLKTF